VDDIAVIVAGISVVLLAAIVGWRAVDLRRQARNAEARRDGALASEDAANRALRVAGTELRNAALALLGHADRLLADDRIPSHHARAINQVSAQIFGLADELQDHAVPAVETRVLHVEPMRLEEPIRDAVAAVTGTLGPNGRVWMIDPDIAVLTVMADRRAMTQVFLRVFTNIARFSRHEARIAVSVAHDDTGVRVLVADTSGIPDPPSGSGILHAGQGGACPGLALARVLMQAHGGDLVVAAAPRFGTSVTVSLPAQRVRVAQTQPVA
jgi:signal transduction histidine kinase